jgi:hypothetical protein
MIWYLQSHFVWLRLSYSSIAKLPFVRVVAHDWKSPRWTTARKVKLLLPPRQSRGISLVIRMRRLEPGEGGQPCTVKAMF